jgi:hypothetical protein
VQELLRDAGVSLLRWAGIYQISQISARLHAHSQGHTPAIALALSTPPGFARA